MCKIDVKKVLKCYLEKGKAIWKNIRKGYSDYLQEELEIWEQGWDEDLLFTE